MATADVVAVSVEGVFVATTASGVATSSAKCGDEIVVGTFARRLGSAARKEAKSEKTRGDATIVFDFMVTSDAVAFSDPVAFSDVEALSVFLAAPEVASSCAASGGTHVVDFCVCSFGILTEQS